MQGRVAVEAVGGFRAAAEVQEVRAAAHRYVRRKIDELIGASVMIGAGPAARRGGLFEDFDMEPSLHRRHGCRQPGHAAADNGHGRRGWSGGRHGVDDWAKGSGGRKEEIRNSKLEIRNKFAARRRKSKTFCRFAFHIFCISYFEFGICFGFRVSDFGFFCGGPFSLTGSNVHRATSHSLRSRPTRMRRVKTSAGRRRMASSKAW